jgi:hypothetical protein
MSEGPTIHEVRIALAVIFLCVGVFVGCFAVGRAERPKPSTAEDFWSSPAPATGGASIPLALASAPRIDMRDISANGRSASKRSNGTTTKSTAGAAGIPARATLAPGTSSALTVSAPTAAPEAAAGPSRHAPAANTKAAGSKSFDSSD